MELCVREQDRNMIGLFLLTSSIIDIQKLCTALNQMNCQERRTGLPGPQNSFQTNNQAFGENLATSNLLQVFNYILVAL